MWLQKIKSTTEVLDTEESVGMLPMLSAQIGTAIARTVLRSSAVPRALRPHCFARTTPLPEQQ